MLPCNLHDLCERTRAGEAFSFLHFYGHSPRKDGQISTAVFSQFWPCRFVLGGQEYHWAEQWMMAGKARLFRDGAALAQVMAAASPMACKQAGRAVTPYDDARWAAARFGLVTEGNVAKFGQDPALREHLLGTGDAILVEAARRDRVWGSGLDRTDPDAGNPLAWPGLNLLGFALTRARSILRGEA